jgi:hypothetical protein
MAGPFEFAQVPGDGESHARRQDFEMGIPSEESKEIWIRVGIEYNLNHGVESTEMGVGDQGDLRIHCTKDDHQPLEVNNIRWTPLTHQHPPVPSLGQRT